MAIMQALIAMLVRSLGKILNVAFGWATQLLFGKVPDDRQIYLSVMGLLSLLWSVCALGILFPGFSGFLLAFVWLPEWIDRGWIRLAMALAALLLPLGVGAVGLFLREPERRPVGRARWLALLRGYRFAFGLAVTLALMLVVGAALKARDLVRWWTTAHVPILIDADHYVACVDQIERALQDGGHAGQRRPASALLRWPSQLLSILVGDTLDHFIAAQLTSLRGRNFEVVLHPFDLIVRGREATVGRLRMLLAERLPFTYAHLTWSAEARAIEDDITRLWRHVQDQDGLEPDEHLGNALSAIEQRLCEFQGTYEEWEVLFRERLLVERAMPRRPTAKALARLPVTWARHSCGRRAESKS